jgi:Dimethlysulfonioproprionate lyase
MTTAPVAQLLQALAEAVGARVTSADEKRMHQEIFQHLPLPAEQSAPLTPRTQPACRNLGRCYVNIDSSVDSRSRAVAEALRTIEPQLHWRSYDATEDSPSLDVNYADAILVGSGGLIHSDLIEIGVFVMSPNTFYPDHHHIERELYLALSAGKWRQQANEWIEPGIGNLIYNYPDVIHSMESDGEPMLAIWSVPLNETID